MSLIYNILRYPFHLYKNFNKKISLLINKLFFKIDKNYLRKKFLDLGLKEGMNVYVHSSLSKFGYIEDGANSVIQVLNDVIKNGTIMVPTFTFPKDNFSLDDSCWTGKLAETFRKNAKRSVHLTHSVAVKGKHESDLIKYHIKSKKPFDKNSPFAKFAKLDSYILMLGTENNSMIHHVQNNVNFPNLFLEEIKEYKFGNKILRTRLHHPKGSIIYIYNQKPCSDVYFLVRMYKDLRFEERKIMKTVKIGKAICHLIKTREFVEEATKYLKENIKRYKNEYTSRLKE